MPTGSPLRRKRIYSEWSYIAQDSVEAAEKVESEIYEACAFLAATPYAGHVRLDLTSLPLRFWTLSRFSRYILVYDHVSNPSSIIRILHGATDLAPQFG